MQLINSFSCYPIRAGPYRTPITVRHRIAAWLLTSRRGEVVICLCGFHETSRVVLATQISWRRLSIVLPSYTTVYGRILPHEHSSTQYTVTGSMRTASSTSEVQPRKFQSSHVVKNTGKFVDWNGARIWNVSAALLYAYIAIMQGVKVEVAFSEYVSHVTTRLGFAILYSGCRLLPTVR